MRTRLEKDDPGMHILCKMLDFANYDMFVKARTKCWSRLEDLTVWPASVQNSTVKEMLHGAEGDMFAGLGVVIPSIRRHWSGRLKADSIPPMWM